MAVGGEANIIVQTQLATDLGIKSAVIKLCRAQSTICANIAFEVNITEPLCTETLMGVEVPDLFVYLQDNFFDLQFIIPPFESKIGGCGQIRYKINPSPELFELDMITRSVKVNLGLITPNWLGTKPFTLTAYYADFPTVSTSYTFNLHVKDQCQEPPFPLFIIEPMSYTLGQALPST